ncbi:MAG: hypothetical protein HY323_05550 [Betaproteobacteria bacterium]|nr:hypothetical protein [Betaproteobacteria bacterium]
MPSVFRTPSRSGSVFRRGRGGGAPIPVVPKQRRPSGVGGFFRNLGGDVEGALLGLPGGLKAVSEALGADLWQTLQEGPSRFTDTEGRYGLRPKLEQGELGRKVLRPVAESYKQTYGPLFRGEVDEFLQQVYEHPLGPILDIATVLTLGSGASAKGAQAASRAGAVSKTGRVGRFAERAREPGRVQLRGPGEEASVLEGKRLFGNPLIRSRQKLIDRALKRLPPGTPLVGEWQRYARAAQRAPRQEALGLRLQSRNYLLAVDKLNGKEMAAFNLIRMGPSPREWVAYYLREGVDTPLLRVLENPEIQRLWETPSKKLQIALDEGRKLSKVLTETKLGRDLLGEVPAAERPWLHLRLLSGARFVVDPETGRSLLQGGKPIEQLRAELAAAGRPEPFYAPDRMVAEYVGNPALARQGGGLGVPKVPGSTRKTRAVLAQTGRLALEPDLLGPEFLRTVKYGLYEDLHDALMASAERVPKGAPLRKGWVYVRRKVGRSPEKIPYTQQKLGEFERDLERLLPDLDDDTALIQSLAGESGEILEQGGFYLAVPRRFAKELTGEFNRASSATRKIWEVPTTVWRALILGTRPAFLVNNLVGNNLLYALKFAGRDGLAAYLDALRTTKGGQGLAKLLRSDSTRGLIDDEFMREFFPEQVEGVFGLTQMPGIRSPNIRRSVRAGRVGIIPATQAVAEGTLRRAGVTAALRRSPAVKARLRAMPKETRSLKEAARKELADNPALARQVSDKVNDALGNYLNMSPVERDVLRGLAPFYAWYRTITIITVKLPLNTPGRTNALVKIGEIGAEDEKLLGKLPSYLRGAIPLGPPRGGLQDILLTQAPNPFSTPLQVGMGLRTLGPGAPGRAGGELTGSLNPYIIAASRLLAALEKGEAPKYGLPADILAEVGQTLPPVRLLLGPRESRIYPERRTRLDELLSQAGFSRRRISLAEARRQAALGR